MKNLFFLILILVSITLSSRVKVQNLLQTSTHKVNLKLTSQSKTSIQTKVTTQTSTKQDYYNSSRHRSRSTVGAFICFIIGLLLLPLAICCTFWNERTAVKDTLFTDILLDNKVKEYNSQNLGTDVILENNVHIYHGTINILEDCKINGLELEEHILKQNHLAPLNPSNLPANPSNLPLNPSNLQPNATNNKSAEENQALNLEKTGDQTLNYSQTINDKNGITENSLLNPIIGQVQTHDKKFLAFDFIIEDFVEKIIEEEDYGVIKTSNIWSKTNNSGLFSENDGLYTGIYNFDNKIRVKDHRLLIQCLEEQQSILNFNENLKEQFKNYLQIHESYKSHNI